MPRNLHTILFTVAGVMIAYNVAWRFVSVKEHQIKSEIRRLESKIVDPNNKLSNDERSNIVTQFNSIQEGISSNYSIADISRILAPIILMIGLLVRTNIENEKKSQAFQMKQLEAERIAENSANETQ